METKARMLQSKSDAIDEEKGKCAAQLTTKEVRNGGRVLPMQP